MKGSCEGSGDEGFARFCGKPYPSGEKAKEVDLTAHLTNTAVSDGKGKAAGGEANVILASQVWDKLAALGHDATQIQHDVSELLQRVFAKVGPAVAQERKASDGDSSCEFSLLGVDVILDADLRPWLLEINYNPDMTCHALLQRPVKTAVVHSIYDLVMKREGEGAMGDGLDADVDIDSLNWVPASRDLGQAPPLLGGWAPLLPC